MTYESFVYMKMSMAITDFLSKMGVCPKEQEEGIMKDPTQVKKSVKRAPKVKEKVIVESFVLTEDEALKLYKVLDKASGHVGRFQVAKAVRELAFDHMTNINDREWTVNTTKSLAPVIEIKDFPPEPVKAPRKPRTPKAVAGATPTVRKPRTPKATQ